MCLSHTGMPGDEAARRDRAVRQQSGGLLQMRLRNGLTKAKRGRNIMGHLT